jgi:hypothetical protein
MRATLTTYQQILTYKHPKTKVKRNKGKQKASKYRPYTHRVVGMARGEWVIQCYKSLKAAQRFADTLYNPKITVI